MKKIIFTYDCCPQTGEYGLIADSTPLENRDRTHAATEGRLVAHDVLEHDGPHTLGGIGNELEALGVLWWIRGSLHDLNRNSHSLTPPHEAVARDVSEMALKTVFLKRRFDLGIPRTCSCIYDADFLDIIEQAREIFRRESNCYVNTPNHDMVEYYFGNCLHFLRAGYRKAKRRFRRLNQTRVNTLFWNIADAIDEALECPLYPGSCVELRYSLTTTAARCQIVSLDDIFS